MRFLLRLRVVPVARCVRVLRVPVRLDFVIEIDDDRGDEGDDDDAVNAELAEDGISAEAIEKLQPIIKLSGSNAEKLATMKQVLAESEIGLKGIEECEFVLNTLAGFSLKNEVELDLTLARGLNYYTGCIFEVKALDWQIGSICGGGRYDNLTGIFGLPDMSGVGVSFGADRIYDVLKGLDKFPKGLCSATRLLLANMGADEVRYLLPVAAALRAEGVAVEVYPDAAKLKKQFDYADRKAIPFLSITGASEMEQGVVNLKNLASGEQKSFSREDIPGILSFLA